jgi:RHS repeat-associated protein
VFFIQPDQLDTPRVVVNASNQAVWKWDSAPFGETTANERPTPSIATNFAFNLRFPGQQFDAETALHYNYFRDYEPSVGRYVQSDPIGLEGGINAFVYADDPLQELDLFGLKKSGGKTGKSSGNSNSTPGPCVVYAIRSGNGLYKVGESCRGSNRKELKRRCESQARKLGKTTGIVHRCIVSPAIPCSKGTIKRIEGFFRDLFRKCGCKLPGNNEHKKGKK